MAVVKAVNSRASIGRAVNYVTRTEKTEERLVSGIECSPQNAIEEMKATKALWGKEDGRQYKHFVHSFPPGEKITPEQAHELARELCQDRFKGYEVLIATHKDKGHIHSHIIVNSVSYEDGKKLHLSKGHLEQMKRDCIEQCRQHGLSVPVKGQEITSNKQTKYKALERGIKAQRGEGEYKSYVLDCYKAADTARSAATSREDFIGRMQAQGWETSWEETRKHITFTDRDGNKVRAANLEKTFREPFTKEDLARGFEINAERAAVHTRAADALEQARGRGADRRPDGADHSPDLDKFRTGIDESRAAIRADDAARADHLTDREGQQRDQDRELEREIERASRRSPDRER